MPTCQTYKIDSNITGLTYTREDCPKILSSSPVWKTLEPNSYSDFGAQLTTLTREPINNSRQLQKGVVSDLEATAGFSHDLVADNLNDFLESAVAGRWKRDGGAIGGFTAVTTDTGARTMTITGSLSGTQFKGDDLVMIGGTGNAKNNGLRVVRSSNANSVTLNITKYHSSEVSAENQLGIFGYIEIVGKIFAPGMLNARVTSEGQFFLSRQTGQNRDLRAIGLTAGQWVYLGSDYADARFEKNTGFGRVSIILESAIFFDKVTWKPENEEGTGKTLTLFLGQSVSNPTDGSVVYKDTYQLKRTLGNDANGQMTEYVIGAALNEMSFNIPVADKITTDLSFIAADVEHRTGQQGPRDVGTTTNQPSRSAFNTTSDVLRIRLGLMNDSSTKSMFAYCTELNFSINNNISTNKAVGVLGALDTSFGAFKVSGNLTAYFADVDALKALRNNESVTLDFIISDHEHIMIFDVPAATLGDGKLNVEKDQAITVPLEFTAYEHPNLNTSLSITSFNGLPKAAHAR